MPRPHPLMGRKGLVNGVEFVGLEAYYGICIILWCLRKRPLKALMSTKRNRGYSSGGKMYVY